VDGGLVEKKYKNGSERQKLETLIVDRDANLRTFVAANQRYFAPQPLAVRLLWRLRRSGYARLH
jgi:hypothetical protein